MLGISEPVISIKNTFLTVEQPEPEPVRRSRSVPADFRPCVATPFPEPPTGYMYLAISADEFAFKEFCQVEFGTTQSDRRWALTGSASGGGIPIAKHVNREALVTNASDIELASRKDHVDASPISTAAGSDDLPARVPSDLSDGPCSDAEEAIQEDAFPGLQSWTAAPVHDSFANAEAQTSVDSAHTQADAQCTSYNSPQVAKQSSPKHRRRTPKLKESCPAAQKQSQTAKTLKNSLIHDAAAVKESKPMKGSLYRSRWVRFTIIMGVFFFFYAVGSDGRLQNIVEWLHTFYANIAETREGVYRRRGELKPAGRICACQDSRVWRDEDGDDCFVYKTYIENGVATRNDACTEGVIYDSNLGDHCSHTCRRCTCEGESYKDEEGSKLAKPTENSLLALYRLHFTNRESVQRNVDSDLSAKALETAAGLGYKD